MTVEPKIEFTCLSPLEFNATASRQFVLNAGEVNPNTFPAHYRESKGRKDGGFVVTQ